MSYEIIVRPEAAREVQEAFDWYQEKTEGLGLEFLRGRCLFSRRTKKSARFSDDVSGHSSGVAAEVPVYTLLHCQRRTNHRAGVLSCPARPDRLDAARLSQARR